MKKLVNFLLFIVLIFSFNVSNGQEATSIEWKFYEMAEKNRILKRYKTAIAEYENAILLNPNESDYYLGLGLCYAQTKQFAKATESFEKGLTVNPKSDRTYNYLLKAYKTLNYKDKAVDVLDRWAENTENLNEKLAKKSQIIRLLYDTNDFLEALKHTKDALKTYPQHLETLYLHAKVNNKLGNYAEAKVSLLKATGLLENPQSESASKVYYELGYSLHHLQEYNAKDKAFQKVANEKYRPLISKLYAPYYTNLAAIYTQMYEFNIAQTLLQEALKVDKHYSQANKLYAQIEEVKPTNSLPKAAYKKEVINLYSKGIQGILSKIGEDRATAAPSLIKELYTDYRHLIETNITVGAYKEAIIASEEAMQFFSTPNYTHKFNYLKAIALFKQDKAESAVEVLKEAIASQALPIEYKRKYSFVIGHIQHRKGDLDAAKQAYYRSFESKYGIAAHYGFDNITIIENSNGLMLDSTKLPMAQLFRK